MDKNSHVLNSLYNHKLSFEKWYPDICAWYYKEWQDYDMQPHSHDRVEIMYVLKGSCSVAVGSEEMSLKKGDFILIDAEVLHKLSVAKGTTCRMLNVEFGFKKGEEAILSISQMFQTIEEFRNLFDRKKAFAVFKDNEEVYHCLKSLILEMNRGARAEHIMVQTFMMQLMVKISRLFAIQDSNGYKSNEYVEKAKSYILTHYDTAISVTEIAAHVAVHPVHLQRLFKKETDSTINDFLIEVRLEKSKMLLTNTEIPIIDICDYVGLNSRQYFNFIFKKNTGKSPSQYRKESNLKFMHDLNL